MIETGTLMGFLLVCSLEDIRQRKVNSIWILICGILAVVFHLCWRRLDVYEMLLGALPGVGLLLVSKITGGKVGAGDGLLLIVTGFFLGWQKNTAIFFVGTCLAGIYSLFQLWLKRKKKEDEIAFVPFLSLGYLLILCLERGICS